MRRTPAAALAAVLWLFTGSAEAQVWQGASDVPRRGSWEIGGGVIWTGGFDVDGEAAQLTGNGSDSPVTLFEAEARLRPIAGVQARAGFYLSRALAFEAGFQFAQPVLAVSVSDDFEDAPSLTIEETIGRYVFDGSLVYHFGAASGGRTRPFVTAGAGYIRELHERDEFVETGTTYHAGAGIKYWLGQGRRRLGVRLEGGVVVRDGAFDGDTRRRTMPTAGASLIYLF